jgi:hypothetical protein
VERGPGAALLLIARVYLTLRPVKALRRGRRAGVGKNHWSRALCGKLAFRGKAYHLFEKHLSWSGLGEFW